MFLVVFVFPFLGLPLFFNLLGFQFLTCKSGSKDNDTTYECTRFNTEHFRYDQSGSTYSYCRYIRVEMETNPDFR